MDKVIIIGFNGQDGQLLSRYLKDDYIIGITRDKIIDLRKNEIFKINSYSKEAVFELINKYKPDYLYYLAGYHHSSEEMQSDNVYLLEQSNFTHFLLYGYYLEAIRKFSNKTRVFYAASSLIFGYPEKPVQDEKTPVNPQCVYGITKAAGFFLGRYYREQFGIFVSNGVLYNHESSLRRGGFLFPKIIKTALAIKKGDAKELLLGDLDAVTDWSSAKDVVLAFKKILQSDSPDDFIIASGEGHTVRELVEIVFSFLGMDYKKYVKEDKSLLKRKKPVLIGNPEKLMKKTGWKPSSDFKSMVINILKDFTNG